MCPTSGQSPQASLNEIATVWSQIFLAHVDDLHDSMRGQAAVLERYMGAVLGYLREAVRDPCVAEDLAQDFAYRFLKGDFRGADPARGKFRNFLKTILRNQVIDHFRKQQSRQEVPVERVDALPVATTEELDDSFRDNWRSWIMRQAWLKLDGSGKSSGRKFCLVLQSRADFPDHSSSELARTVSGQLGYEVTADWVRQNLKRARERFAALLREEVALTLEGKDQGSVEEELIELDLDRFCGRSSRY